MSNRGSPAPRNVMISPQEEALQSLCKQVLKSRIFQGNYRERRYVEAVGAYRDIILLQREEKDFEKLLLDLRHKLQLFYFQSRMWIGVTHVAETGISWQPGSLQTCVWAELDGLAFGHYWFSVKSLRFRQNEIILKLKVLRPVDNDITDIWTRRRLSSTSSVGTTRSSAERQTVASTVSVDQPAEGAEITTKRVLKPNAAAAMSEQTTAAANAQQPPDFPQVGMKEFMGILEDWSTSIKHTVYDFMSNDISKDNIKGVLRFLGLFIVAIISGGLAAIKFLGVFVLRFMLECSRLIHILTPIILKIIDVLNKMIGGFYILLAMIWRDLIHGRQPAKQVNNSPAVEYKPAYKSIEYTTQPITARRYQFSYHGSQLNQDGPGQQSNMTDFERKFQ